MKEVIDLPICEICGRTIKQHKAIYYNDYYICACCEFTFWQNIREDFLIDIE